MLAALAASTAALSLPMPQASAPTTAAVPAGPSRLHDAWPAARTVTITGSVAGGLGFEPLFVVDDTTIVGLARTLDQTVARLVVRTENQALRVLRVLPASGLMSVAAVLVSGDDVFWLEFGANAGGIGTTSVWRAGLRNGAARRLSNEVGDLVYFDSQYDLELVGGRLYWAVFTSQARSEIHSMPANGGRIEVRRFDRVYALTTWPWATKLGRQRYVWRRRHGQPGDGGAPHGTRASQPVPELHPGVVQGHHTRRSDLRLDGDADASRRHRYRGLVQPNERTDKHGRRPPGPVRGTGR